MRSSSASGSGSNEIRSSPRSVAATSSSPERSLDEVVARVEHAAAGGGVAEAPVEVGGNAHVVFSFRSRRTPVEAAWRAASGLESSAAAICS